jgi:hypothetical protein
VYLDKLGWEGGGGKELNDGCVYDCNGLDV